MNPTKVWPPFAFLVAAVLLSAAQTPSTDPVTLKRSVELALAHSTAATESQADQQRAFSSYREAKNQYLPQLLVGSGLGQSWGYPLSLEGAAPSLLNVTSQSALFNPSLRDFVRAAKIDWQASIALSRDQRNQIIQDTALTYAELGKWESLLGHLRQQHDSALKMEQAVNARIQEGVDNPQLLNQARLITARTYLRITEAQGAIDVLRLRLSQSTGLPVSAIVISAESIPPLPEVHQQDDLANRAADANPAVEAANIRATALRFRARGEHRALLPSFDFAAQYALLSTFNNYETYFRAKSFQPHNATIGVAFRFPLLNFSQRAHAAAADAEALHAKKQAEATKNQVSEETLRLQRSVEQLAAAHEVAKLEYQISQSDLDAMQIRTEAGTATFHEAAETATRANERFDALQDTNFELEKAHITLLRATGELAAWVGVSP